MMRESSIKAKIFFLIAFFQVFSLQCIYAQPSNNSKIIANSSYVTKTCTQFQHEEFSDEDSSSSKISAIPIIAFGFGGMILGGIIGSNIDQGSYLDITKTELTWIVLGTATGVTIGYFLAKKDQKQKR